MGIHWKEIDLYPVELEFSVFSPEDIKKISVVQVISGLTFDSLGRPLRGGLYDPRMGCYGRSADPCETCFLTNFCPGHIGHIELNALLYNPFFLKLVADILKISCMNCHKLQIPEHVADIVILQLHLVDAGYVIEAQELEVFKSRTVYESTLSAHVKTETGQLQHPKIAEMHALLAKGLNIVNVTKTSCAIRQNIIQSALHYPTIKKCIHCNEHLKSVKISYKKLVVGITKFEINALKEKADKQGDKATIFGKNKVLLGDECRAHLREIYKNNAILLQELFPILKCPANGLENPVDVLFMDIIPVTPSNARPPNFVKGEQLDHPQTTLYRNILEANSVVRLILVNIKTNGANLKEEEKDVYNGCRGSNGYEKMYYAWQGLQDQLDQLLDVASIRDKSSSQGLKQLIEKKDGLIRKHMMGKRVNYAARTVITPDPNINVEEIGIPDIFARKLSYPVPVTSWNISELRKMVRNGPEVHPGANYIEDERGNKIIIPPGNAAKRESLAKLLLTNPENGIKIVHRHLLNGDVLLLNRQPTLHKPSIMAHKARILQGEKTFRLHYSNCKSYNADFDGDEMNAHFPQSELARSEAYNIVNVENQYLVPKDGTPLGGLIQDHVISGVKLSIRGRFFNKEDYQQLVFQGLPHVRGRIKLLPPAIIKPKRLWSGKQILSTILINLIPEGYPPINLASKAKINDKIWMSRKAHIWTHGGSHLKGVQMSESEVIIRAGELLVGVLDKQQYGATQYGLVHCMYELYGGQTSTRLLTAFTKVFTTFLQREGFTLGVHDILVTGQADEKRRKIIKECRLIGDEVVANALELDEVPTVDILAKETEEAYIKIPKFRVILDRKYKSMLDKYTNQINKVCLPAGLISKFPENNLQLMVLSGAKGSMVNTMQISCLLGQIELEGKRPPLMISGKSLPSFAAFETSPKSGGFIDGRFMTGIQPQDFFFHCMAGREGLIDTAVKTSRSGYLQRCLIKHLEGLNVNYDLTVRDSDNSVIQFMYGEDGMDILKARFLNKNCLSFLDDNANVILHASQKDKIANEDDLELIRKHMKKLKHWRKKNGNPKEKRRFSSFQKFSAEIRDEIEVENPNELNTFTGRLNIDEKIIALWKKANPEDKEKYKKKFAPCPDPVFSTYKPDSIYGAINEYIEDLMNSYMDRYPQRESEIRDILYIKSIKSMAAPGEPVGLLAAQSIGEPSTQMTLNTFHFAGRGEMNVTLGIPRLREILMMASANIKTPSMDIPFKPNQKKNSDKMRVRLNRVTVADVLETVNVKVELVHCPERAGRFIIKFNFLPREAYQEDFCIKPKMIIKHMSDAFFKALFRAIGNVSKSSYTAVEVGDEKQKETGEKDDEDEDNIQSDKPAMIDVADSSEEDEGDGDISGIKLKNRKHDENEYEDPEEEEILDALAPEEYDDAEPDVLEEKDQMDVTEDELLSAVMEHSNVNDFNYDKENYLWCRIVFQLPVKYRKVDISNILKELAKKSIIYQVDKIKRAITYQKNTDLILKTEGINIVEMFKYNKLLDLNRLYTNDIHAIAKTYGIEAAAKVIVKEVQNVFSVYGITVDPRHLLLIADYMTSDGTFRPLSRKGMEHSSSPLQQMSFESSLQFLKSATINGRRDELNSPSSRLMVGLPGKNGTGAFTLLSKLC